MPNPHAIAATAESTVVEAIFLELRVIYISYRCIFGHHKSSIIIS